MTPARSAQWTRRMEFFSATVVCAILGVDYPLASQAHGLLTWAYERWAIEAMRPSLMSFETGRLMLAGAFDAAEPGLAGRIARQIAA